MSSLPRILTWPVHGAYMDSLAHAPVEWILPIATTPREGYGGRWPDWPETVREVAGDEVPSLRLDGVLYQSRRNWEVDRFGLLSDAQVRLPSIYLEHDPPRGHPTDTRHWVDHPDAMLVHVTHFNDLMWDSGRTPTRVIEHGVCVSAAIRYRGDIERGIVVINELARRGRRLGADLFETVRRRVPLDLVGIGAEELGGLGEVRPRELASFESRYRFFFHPVRYTSLGLALCEAMQVGMPIVGLATTELPTVIEDGVQGFIATDVERLIESMGLLIADHGLARTLGAAARARGRERFGIERFARDWRAVIDEVCGRTSGRSPRRARTRIGATRPRSARQGTTRAPRRQPDATGR